MGIWEYMWIRLSRDVQFEPDEIQYWIFEPESEPREIEVPGEDGSSFTDLLNKLGSQGWELVGPPIEVKVAMTYANSKGHYMNYADWTRQSYLFKRPKP
jgi:hypothetical protein